MLTSISSRRAPGCAQSDFAGESNFHEDKKQFSKRIRSIFLGLAIQASRKEIHETRHGNQKMPWKTTRLSCVFWILFTHDNVHPLENYWLVPILLRAARISYIAKSVEFENAFLRTNRRKSNKKITTVRTLQTFTRFWVCKLVFTKYARSDCDKKSNFT